MENQYIFVCTNVGNESLLKEEVRVFYPELSLSYSRKGFITFKNKGILYNIDTIAQLALCFATRAGLCLGKSSPDQIKEKIEALDIESPIIHSFSVNTAFELDSHALFGDEVNKYSAFGKHVIDIICLGEKEVWYGLHTVAKGTTRYPNAKLDIKVPESSPSKSYLKLAQIIELYSISFNKHDSWIDFGCAPGGASHYLLSKGCKVWGVDPALVDNSITSHMNFNHIQKSVQDLSQEELPDCDIHWIHVDLNLNAKQGIKEVLRLIKKYNFSIKGIIFTIQIIKMDHVKNIENYEDHFFEWGFKDIISRQVPSHKNEYVIIATK